MIHLRMLLPAEVLLDKHVVKVTAEGRDGHFCLLPNHIDFTSLLVPGLFSYETGEGREVFLAVDEGVLVKVRSNVLVSARDAVAGEDLGTLERTIRDKFRVLDDREKIERSAVAKIEANFVRRFMELQTRA
ncbi:MAG: F0F1 ATP synthase subunit epsilon [Thermodesulfobacteriota bacterium]